MSKRKPHKFINGVELKHCSKCNEWKDLTSFSKEKTPWDGLKANCKDCANQYAKQYYQQHKEERKQYSKQYWKQNWGKARIRGLKERHLDYGFKPEDFDLTAEFLDSILPEYCPLSNIKLVIGKESGRDNSPSLDRMDNNKGYNTSNVMVVANIVNSSKCNLTYQEWLEILINIREAVKNKIWLELVPGKVEEAICKGITGNRKRDNKAKRNLEFDITHEDIIFTDYCPITGLKFKKPTEGEQNERSRTIDRIDNSKGYIKGNVWCISNIANVVKQTFSMEEITGPFFETLINNVKDFLASQNQKLIAA